MNVKLNSYIHFNGNAKEAVEFYKSVFGGEIFIDTFRNYNSDEMPVAEEDLDKVMHASLIGENGIELMFSDTPSNMQFNDGERISLTLNGDDDAKLREYWDKLAESGTVTMPLAQSPWGSTFGMLIDKYGINWMIDISPEDPRTQQV